jgi:hypothetical protein
VPYESDGASLAGSEHLEALLPNKIGLHSFFSVECVGEAQRANPQKQQQVYRQFVVRRYSCFCVSCMHWKPTETVSRKWPRKQGCAVQVLLPTNPDCTLQQSSDWTFLRSMEGAEAEEEEEEEEAEEEEEEEEEHGAMEVVLSASSSSSSRIVLTLAPPAGWQDWRPNV